MKNSLKRKRDEFLKMKQHLNFIVESEPETYNENKKELIIPIR